MESFDRNKYIKDIEYLKNRVINKDGSINRDLYWKWFKGRTESSENSPMKDVIERIKEANLIVLEAYNDLEIDKEKAPLNGALKKESLVKFILDRTSDERRKEDIKEILSSVLNKDANGRDEDDNNDENSGNSSNGQSDVLEDAIRIIITYTANENEKAIRRGDADKTLSTDIKDFTKILRENGFTDRQIAEKFKKIESEILKSPSSPLNQKAKRETYNPYMDWRYLYYMWTLGVSFNIYLTPESFAYRDRRMEKQSEVNKRREAVSESVGTEDSHKEKTIYEQPYILRFIQLEGKYDLNIDLKQMREDFRDSGSQEEMGETYRKYLKIFYLQGKDRMKSMLELSKDYESFIEDLAIAEDFKHFQSYGGMSGDEFFKFTMGLREKDCDLTLVLENELISNCGEISKVNPDTIIDYSLKKFNESIARIADDDEESQDYIRESMACLCLMERIHEGRTKSFIFKHPISYFKERSALNSMKERMEDKMTRIHEQDMEEFQEMRTTSMVFKRGFEEERRTMRTFSMNLVSMRMDRRIIVDDSVETTRNDRRMENTRTLDEISQVGPLFELEEEEIDSSLHSMDEDLDSNLRIDDELIQENQVNRSDK